MKSILIGITLVLLCFSTLTKAQSNLEDIVREGIQYHDNGEFKNAIEAYELALKIDSKSPLVHYEMALSYFSMEEYEKAIKHVDVVIQQKGDLMLQSYLIKGSALDILGKTKESIQLFEKAIKKNKGHYLLHYNLALNYYRQNDVEKAEKNVIMAIENNPNHASSHLFLATIENQKGNKVQSLLAVHYFLFLEPNSIRSPAAYELLQKNFGGNVSRDDSKPNTINISISPNSDKQFGAVELMISMLEASKSIDKNKDKTEDEMFLENTGSFFKVLGELKKKGNKEIWWTFYTTFFYDLAKSDHLEAYCNYISQSENENAQKWLENNEAKLDDFDKWLKKK